MCCEPRVGYDSRQINGECPFCGSPTVDGDAYDQCCYSEVECEECGWAPCDGSC